MADKRYPIGTKVRYVGSCEQCKNTTGEIIYVFDCYCEVRLPESPHCASTSTGWVPVKWSDIEPLVLPNQQLLFSFME